MPTIHIENDNFSVSQRDCQVSVRPELIFATDAGRSMKIAERLGSCAVYGVEDHPTAVKLANDAAWLARNCYGRQPLVIKSPSKEVSEANIGRLSSAVSEFMEETGRSGLLILSSLDNIIGEDPNIRSEQQARMASLLTGLLEKKEAMAVYGITSRPQPKEPKARVFPGFAHDYTFQKMLSFAF